MTKAGGADITLTWGSSCFAPTDNDYAIYEGTIGTYYSHSSRFCSTGGALTKTFTPLGGNKYYLVVPLNGQREGSYGLNSAGSERAAGAGECLPQLFEGCP